MAIDELSAGRGSKLFINNLLKGEFYLGTEFQGLPGLSLESVFSFALVFTCFSPRRSSGRLLVSFFLFFFNPRGMRLFLRSRFGALYRSFGVKLPF